MTIMWCDKDKRRIFLQSCVSCECKLRAGCQAYGAIDAGREAAAIADVQANHHPVKVSSMPLLSVSNEVPQ